MPPEQALVVYAANLWQSWIDKHPEIIGRDISACDFRGPIRAAEVVATDNGPILVFTTEWTARYGCSGWHQWNTKCPNQFRFLICDRYHRPPVPAGAPGRYQFVSAVGMVTLYPEGMNLARPQV